jgi:hypothetical protein
MIVRSLKFEYSHGHHNKTSSNCGGTTAYYALFFSKKLLTCFSASSRVMA